MTLRLATALFLLPSMMALQTAADESTPRVVTQDPTYFTTPRTPEPWLIPIRLLTTPFGTWSQENQQRAPQRYHQRFADQVEQARRLGLSGECTPAEGLASHGGRFSMDERDPPISIFDVAGTVKNILIGEVIETEPAWDAMTRQIATLVHLEVTRVVRSSDPIAMGDVVTFRRNWGTVTVGGITICSYPGALHPQPQKPWENAPERKRPVLMILGLLVPGNALFMDTNGFEEFPFIEGSVHYPQGYSYYRDKKPENLDALVSRFEGKARDPVANPD